MKAKRTAKARTVAPPLGQALTFEETSVVKDGKPYYWPLSFIMRNSTGIYPKTQSMNAEELACYVVPEGYVFPEVQSLTFGQYRDAYEKTLAEAERELQNHGQCLDALDDLLEWLDKSISDCRTGIYESEVFGYEAFHHHRHERLLDALLGPSLSVRTDFVVAIAKSELGTDVYYDTVDIKAYYETCRTIEAKLCEYLKERAAQAATYSPRSVDLWLEAVDKIEHFGNDWEATAEEAARLGRIDHARAALAAVNAAQTPAPTSQPPAVPPDATTKTRKRGRPEGTIQSKKRVKAAVAIVERAAANGRLSIAGAAHECHENAGRDGLPTASEADFKHFERSYDNMKRWANRNGTNFTELINLAASNPKEWEERKKTLK